MEKIYDAKNDAQFTKGYIDVNVDRLRDMADGSQVPYRYMHGGFEGTAVRFSFCFPAKEAYEGRFYQYLSPFPGPQEELASLPVTGEDDKIGFAITHGAYYVESNMGSAQIFTNDRDNTMTHRSSAATAEYSRQVAREYYGYEHRPYGYVYGGSGGGYRTTACIENTNAFDGAIPFIIGSPYAIPNCQSTRAYAERVLRNKLPQIIDAMDAGGSGDMYAGLTPEEAEVLKEVTLFGYPPKSWFASADLNDGSLPVLLPGIKQRDPDYFKDYWTVEGYMGADPDSSAVRDRIHMGAKIVRMPVVTVLDEASEGGIDTRNGVNDAWKKQMVCGAKVVEPWLELDTVPVAKGADLYTKGLTITVKSGRSAGKVMQVEKIKGQRVYLTEGFATAPVADTLMNMAESDEVFLDNSDYIAVQTYHRHQVPGADFKAWDQFRAENGQPLYPQQKELLGPGFCGDGPGCKQNGLIQGKIIIVAALMDEQAYPWQADWYRRKVASVHEGNAEDYCRLWYFDHALHADTEEGVDNLHVVTYAAGLKQALIDLANWVEKGIEPLPSTNYTVNIGAVEVAETAKERGGLQPVVYLLANGEKCAYAKTGEKVYFTASADVPDGAGVLTSVEWSFEGEQQFSRGTPFELSENKDAGVAKAEHIYRTPGTYFAVVRVKSERHGNDRAVFTQIKNLDRVRVIVD